MIGMLRKSAPRHDAYFATSALTNHQSSIPAHFTQLARGFSNQALCCWNTLNGITFMSDNWRRVTGLNPEECKGYDLLKFFHAKSKPALLAHLEAQHRQCAAGEDSAATRIKCRIMHNGQWRWFELGVATLGNEAMDERNFLFILQDIHHLIEREDALSEAKRTALLAEQTRTEFLANMNHELRTPLNAILGFAQMMDAEVFGSIDNDTYRDYIQNIQESGQFLLSKINDLIEMSNIQRGQAELSEEEFSIESLVHQAIDLRNHELLAKRIALNTTLAEPELMIRADRLRLLYCISHLLGHLTEHARPGSMIAINAEEAGDTTMLALLGSEVSLPENSPLLQNDGVACITHLHAPSTTQLSLTIVKEYLNLHGIQLQVDNQTYSFTALTLILPKARLRRAELRDHIGLEAQPA